MSQKLHLPSNQLPEKRCAGLLIARCIICVKLSIQPDDSTPRLTPRGTSSAAFVRSTKKINLERRSLRGREISVSSDEEEEDDEDEEGGGGGGKTRKTAKTPPPKRKLKSREELKQQKQNKVGVGAVVALF